MQFRYQAVPSDAHFGVGKASQISALCDALDVERLLIICSATGVQRHSRVLKALAARTVAVFDQVVAHCPQPAVDAAVLVYKEAKADGVVAIGGGSTIGLGKILRAEHGAKFIAVPTTYSGSEITPIYGRKLDGQKRTKIDRAAIPDAVVYDPELTIGLPARQSAATGMNSLAHAVEALYPAEPNPIAFNLAAQAIALHAKALPAVIANGQDVEARADALYAGFLGGLLVSMVGVALHHALGHVLGGLFALEHGDYNAAVLSHVTAFNAPAVPQASQAICEALGADDPGQGLFDLACSIGAPTSLSELGMPKGGITQAADAVVAKGCRNPRPINVAQMDRLLQAAFIGKRPSVNDYAE